MDKQTDTKRIGAGKAGPGRPKGSANKTTTSLKEAILSAAAEHGEDDMGKDGLTGYLRKVAREDVKAFAGLLGRVLPLDVTSGGKALAMPTEIILRAHDSRDD